MLGIWNIKIIWTKKIQIDAYQDKKTAEQLNDDKHCVNLAQLKMLLLLMKIHQFYAHQVS